MTQQMLAGRLGKSKSWVDKIERGVRALDRLSVIQELAEVLRVDAAVLVGEAPRAAAAAGGMVGLEDVRAALARYDTVLGGQGSRPVLPVAELGRRVEHVWLAYQHAQYPQVVRMLPGLLGDGQRAHAAGAGDDMTGLLVQVYRITASVLVKLGDAELAWLAADRAMAVAAAEPLRAAVAAVPLGQALRAAGRGRSAMTVTVTAAYGIAPALPHSGPPQELALCGALLVEAALAAATCGDARGVAELIDQAAEIAERVDAGRDQDRACFGPASVESARVAAAVELGEAGEAVAWHEKATGGSGWGRLPVEHRAAHLIDAARAYLQVGDLSRAGRALVDADRTAPAEVRLRPVARMVLAEVARGGPAVAGLAQLATAVGLTR